MANMKTGFVLYFDSYEQIQTLDASQRGELLTALYRYAKSVCQENISPHTFVSTCDELEPAARMAFCFLATAISRDTAKWLTKQSNCRAAAVQRLAASEASTQRQANTGREEAEREISERAVHYMSANRAQEMKKYI